MKTLPNSAFCLAVIASLVLFSSCKDEMAFLELLANSKDNGKDEVKQRIFYGDEVPIGNGTGKAWVRQDKEGNPVSLGVSLSKEALNQLPQANDEHPFYEYFLPLPAEKSNTQFDHVSLEWNPQGHEPDNIYTSPHFDFHFYMISQEDQNAIAVGDKMEKLPDLMFIPEDYFPTDGGVPGMGKHWLDKTSPELSGESFATTFIYGSYDGHFIFYEPMITLDYILSKSNKTFKIKQPEAFETPGYYPTKYSVKYNSSREEYVISLDGMTERL